MDPGEQTTGTRDEHYNLVSVLYHALHGAETVEIYAVDAEAAGEDELAAFFREVQGMHVETAERAKELLGIGVAAPDAVPPGSDLQDIAPEDVPPQPTGVEPGSMPLPPPAPQSTVPRPDEDLVAETGGVAPDAPAEGEDIAPPAETIDGPDRARSEQREGEQEDKNLIDRIKDRLTGQEESDRHS
ncbi:MAG: hypothetical protein M3266_09410 [Actinomycetota bacterium]|nr:hypothetical protein [Actinomycetota bacterium]